MTNTILWVGRSLACRVGLAAGCFLFSIVSSQPFGLATEGRAGLFFDNSVTFGAFLFCVGLLASAVPRTVKMLVESQPVVEGGLAYPAADYVASSPSYPAYPIQSPIIGVDQILDVAWSVVDA